MIPHDPTPEWAISRMERIVEYGDRELMDAVMELLAAIAPDKETDKFKHEAAWAAIDHGFSKSPAALREAAKHYLGMAA